MELKHITKLENSLVDKIELLEAYQRITEEMAASNLDETAELIAQRQLLIFDIDSKTDEIKNIVENEQKDTQLVLRSILAFKETKIDDTLLNVKQLAKKLESTLIAISHKEKDVVIQMEAIKKKLEEEMLNSNKVKQVVNYCNSFASFSQNGNNFNSLT